ncbi:hypothetical protein TVAG_148130 [Trichomonas vaginalis G3]|uniref:Uncharacterized protein n=1 Tax=Trichomonas vaginalis (strain ATCC PRA-98 / G3) TaxID=412133 RepID=A2FQX1_TRIV3|nr:glycoprotein 38 family [Trichomonas vaginalis G3]EAX92710.1 hypothetical protein TVAG_148130 [Trichomonas vaginalis G3]KAI5487782.1 glycoprotein 38 family [Trichomonas vaginalis G3]|eukprot:XP_001305640.1 hypothetical protein [Trichomonas vaginalis G3]
MEDSTVKFEFVTSGTNDMSNPTTIDTNKPVKVANTENDYTFRFTVPNNVNPGEKNLLIKIVDPTGQESSLFTIPVTITQGKQLTASSITCHKTQDMIPDNTEQLFKCNIDNIETNHVYYKAKIGSYDSGSQYSQFNLDLRMEPVGNDNEFDIYVQIPKQTSEKTSISFAMITSDTNNVIKYSDVTDVKIEPEPKISAVKVDSYRVEPYGITKFDFNLDYICDFQTIRVQYRDSTKTNEEFKSVNSISSLSSNRFNVVINVQKLTNIQFKFIDKFDRFLVIEQKCYLAYISFKCDYKERGDYQVIQGQTKTIKCSALSEMDGYAERKFHFVDYSDGNKNKLMKTSSDSSVQFELALPIISEIAEFKIYMERVNDPTQSETDIVEFDLNMPLKIDFEVSEITDTYFKVSVQTSVLYEEEEDIYITSYSIEGDPSIESGEIRFSSQIMGEYSNNVFTENKQLQKKEFTMTIKIKYLGSQVATLTKNIKYDKPMKILEQGRNILKDSIYLAYQGTKVLLQPGSTSAKISAELGGKNYTLLNNKVVAFDFTDMGRLYCSDNTEIIAVVFSLSDLQADDYLYMTGNGKLSIGTTNDSRYKFDPSKTLIFVVTTFDGNGEFTEFSDYDTDALRIKYYDIDQSRIFNSRRALANYQNFRIIRIECLDPSYQFKLNYETTSSNDKETILINSQSGTHKFAVVEQNSNPEQKPDPNNNNPSPGSNPETKSSPTPDDSLDTKTKGGGNGGLIAGVIIGLLIVIAIVCVVVFFIMKKKKDSIHEDASMEEAVGV